MSINTEITRLQNAKSDMKAAIEAKGVTVSSSATIDSYDDYISQITGVFQEKTATPSSSSQDITADTGYDGLSKVTVNGDANLIASNIKDQVTIFGVTGSVSPYVAPVLQDKTVTPTASGFTVEPDSGYDGLDTVTVETDINLVAGNIKKDVTIFGVTGTMESQPPTLNLQNKTVTPTAGGSTVTADSGYDGLGTVTVNGDANLVAGNIKKNVSIFGVTGSYEGGGSGALELNVYAQTSEPEEPKGVWIKENASGDVYIAKYYNASEMFGCISAVANLSCNTETSNSYAAQVPIFLGQVVVDGYLYSFDRANFASRKYDLATHKDMGMINTPYITFQYTSSSKGLGAYYCESKKCIFVFYHEGKSSSSGDIMYYKYFPLNDTYTTPTYLYNVSGNIACACQLGDVVYIKSTTSGTEGRTFNMKTEVFSAAITNFPSNSIKGKISIGYGSTIYTAYQTYLYAYNTSSNTVSTLSSSLPYTCACIFTDGTYIYLFKNGTNSTSYLRYKISNSTLSTVNLPSGYSYSITYDGTGRNGLYCTYPNPIAYDDNSKTLYLRNQLYGAYAFQLDDSILNSEVSNGDIIIISDPSMNSATEIASNPSISMGVFNTLLKKSGELDNDHLAFWGDGEKWNVFKNPNGDTYTASFDLNGGSGTFLTQTILIGEPVDEPNDEPTKSGYAFNGWYLNDEPYNFGTRPIKNITLIANYEEV